ncbi:TfoX/Sxy family protein [Desulfosporosinus shakirovi]|uniref:TfoX/Sxy family protein n=1 Tax=Desulfosporosinus shakirovi TaxID=2885154 RepID=UPI001E4EE412|nr:TfoX/Sxy family protein [Desulfosporosinus sp. SRJS8]MCB8814409.1 TfoX/Sxy family protein [Desulfosporosinus sp. SRJS8]
MAISESYQEYVVDQLRELGCVSVKKMFGGAGIYYDSLIFGVNNVDKGAKNVKYTSC